MKNSGLSAFARGASKAVAAINPAARTNLAAILPQPRHIASTHGGEYGMKPAH